VLVLAAILGFGGGCEQQAGNPWKRRRSGDMLAGQQVELRTSRIQCTG